MACIKSQNFIYARRRGILPVMTPVALPRLFVFALPDGWLRPLLRRLAGHGETALPPDLEDWQLRDLDLTRPFAGPCRSLTPWLP
jgi:hypothetical protein